MMMIPCKVGAAVLTLAVCALSGTAAESSDAYSDDFSQYGFVSAGEPNWLRHSGAWGVNERMLKIKTDKPESLIFLDRYDFTDCNITVRFQASGAAGGVRAPGVVFRAQDSRSFYYAHFDTRNSQVVLVRHTPLTSWAEICRKKGIKMPDSQWHRAEIRCQGNQIRIFLNDELVIDRADNTYKSGHVGLRAAQGEIAFDDFSVTGTPSGAADWKFEAESSDQKSPRVAAEKVNVVTGSGYFPVMVSLGGNKLGAVIRAGAGHVGISGRLDWVESEDGGRSWSHPKTIADGPFDDRNPALLVRRNGEIMLFFSEASTYAADGRFDLKAGKYAPFVKKSVDGGKTWTAKEPVDVPGYDSLSFYGQGLELADGTLMVPFYWKGGGVLVSSDQGKSWQERIIASRGSEIAIVELEPNRIFAAVRDQGLTGYLSADNGKSWIRQTQLTGNELHPASLTRLGSGKILMSFGHRQLPYGIGAMLLQESRGKITAGEKMLLGWESQSSDCGYPSAVKLPDDTVAILWYMQGSKAIPWKVQAECVRISPEELRQTKVTH